MFRVRPATKELLPLLAAVIVLYWQPALGLGSFFQRDVFLYWIPQVEWAVRSLADGRLPQWNAAFGFGVPFLADPSFQAFYPVTWLNLIFQLPTVFTILVVGHTLLGAWGMFRLLRRRLRSREAAWLGGVVFVGAGALVSSANLWHHYSSAMYMPLAADAFLRVRSGRGGSVRLGVILGLQALAGSADAMLMTALGLAFLLPVRPKRWVAMARGLGAAGLLCAALAAAQWLPTLRGVAGTERTGLSTHDRLYWSVPPSALMDFVLPLTGVAHAGTDELNPLEHRFRIITWMYLGASTVPLLLLGMRRWPRGGVLLLLSLLLSLGRHGPLAWVSDLPIVSMVRFPSKVLWLFSFVWAILCAVGLSVLARRPARHRRSLAVAGVLLLSLAAVLSGSGEPSASSLEAGASLHAASVWALTALALCLLASLLPRAEILVAVVATVDLLGISATVNAYSHGEMLRLRPTAVDVLKQLDATRIFVLPASRQQERSWSTPAGWSDEEAYFFGQGQMLVPPQGVRWGLRGSYDGDFVGLAPRAYRRLSEMMAASPEVSPRWLQMGGVSHVLTFEGKDPPAMEVMARVDTLHEADLLVLRVPDPRPHAYLAARVRTVTSEDEAIAALSAADFDLADQIVRIGDSVRPSSSSGTVAAAVDPVQVLERLDGRTTLHVGNDTPQTLVVLDAMSAGWSARVDGQPVPVQAANLIFLSVDLQPGEHQVELEYQTPGLAAGLAISVLAWMSLLIRAGLRHPRRGGATPGS